jgi:hypothetical protein
MIFYVEILGVFIPLGVVFVAVGMLAMISLMVAIEIDNKRAGK